MKKFIILLVCSMYASSVSAQMIPTLYDDLTTPMITSEPMMCTMEYAPVCSKEGITYSNSCMAGNHKILHSGECDSFVDSVSYLNLESTKTEILKRQLSRYSDAKLLSVLETIDQKIQMVKLSRISKEMQIKKITLYVFVKNTIPKVLK